jgi:hypothetical protein
VRLIAFNRKGGMMSVNVMSLVFKCNMPELKTDKGQTVPDSTAKFVLLALADHCNDEGEGAYPSVKNICKKTNMSTATVVNALNALRTSGFTTMVGRSKRSTYNYTISVAKIAAFQWLESDDSSGQNGGVSVAKVKPLVKPSVKPSVKKKEAAEPQPPEILLFKEVVKHYPKQAQREMVIDAVKKVNARLRRDVTLEDLQPFFKEWCKVSANDWSLVWLIDWAVPGTINGKVNHAINSKPADTQPSSEALARAERINELRRAGHIV